MSEESKPRNLEAINQEYAVLCQKAGHLEYQVTALKEDLALIYKTIRELNLEASKLPKPEGESK